ncbi:MAG TPA: transcription termination factor Rho, partial [Myxococcaceae bacterium]|nr:transcription termination factor Rho [Myxococcaceae bacterium]
MSNETQPPTEPGDGAAEQAEAPPDVEADDGGDEGDEADAPGADGGPVEAGQMPGGQPGAFPPGPGQGRRRRRRRRRRGAQVFFNAEGQAYRMTQGPDGQQAQVLLTPQELQQYQARQAQQPQQQGGRPMTGGGPGPQPAAQLAPVEGVLDTDAKGPNAYLRQLKRNLLASPEDAELPKNLVQKLRLRQGQYITAQAQMRGQKGFIQQVDTVDGSPLALMPRLPHFQDLTSVDPVQRIKLEHGHKEMVTRVLDLIAPIGKGQRGLIVSPPKAGKTIMLQRIAQAITTNHPEVHLMVLLVDERPEEVTDMRRSIKGEILASSSDRPTADHLKVAEMALERARRMVEAGKDVVILLDSITRLARAFNKEIDSSGRTMTGGV